MKTQGTPSHIHRKSSCTIDWNFLMFTFRVVATGRRVVTNPFTRIEFLCTNVDTPHLLVLASSPFIFHAQCFTVVRVFYIAGKGSTTERVSCIITALRVIDIEELRTLITAYFMLRSASTHLLFHSASHLQFWTVVLVCLPS